MSDCLQAVGASALKFCFVEHPLFDFGIAFNNINCWKMVDGVLELLSNLIHSTVDNTIMIDKVILGNIQTCLQNAQEQNDFLQLESQLQQEELKQRSHFEHVSV